MAATTFFPQSATSTRSSASWAGIASPDYRTMLLTRGGGVASVNIASGNSVGTFAGGAGQVLDVWGTSQRQVTILAGTSAEDYDSGVPPGSLVWVTNPLNAVTIAGAITVNIRALETNAMANEGVGAFVYKIAAGNGAATKIGLGGGGAELGTVEAARSITITPTSTALADGDMLALVICNEGVGVSASGFTITGFWNGASGATGDTFVTFTETITEQAVALAPRERIVMQAVARSSFF